MSAGEIRIADLANPVLTPAQRAAIEFAETQPVRFDVETILGAARAKTGLGDFGRADFRARLAIQCQSIEEDSGLNALGRLGVFANLLRYTENRLRFEDLLRRHPEILETRIERPIIVAGMPRTGTTHLLIRGLAARPARIAAVAAGALAGRRHRLHRFPVRQRAQPRVRGDQIQEMRGAGARHAGDDDRPLDARLQDLRVAP